MTSLPHVLIVVPTYNHESYIVECLSSIESQTYPHIHVLCIDDCSTDNTFNLAKAWASMPRKYQYSVLKNSTNLGIRKIFSNATPFIRASNAHYISFFSGDDIFMYPDKISVQVELLHLSGAASCITGYTIFNSLKSRDISLYDYFKLNPSSFFSPQSSLGFQPWVSNLIDTNAYFSVANHIPSIAFADYALYILLTTKYGPPTFTNQILSAYRTHSDSIVSSFHLSSYLELYLWIIKFFPTQIPLFLTYRFLVLFMKASAMRILSYFFPTLSFHLR